MFMTITVLSVRHEEQNYTVVILQTRLCGQSLQFCHHHLSTEHAVSLPSLAPLASMFWRRPVMEQYL